MAESTAYFLGLTTVLAGLPLNSTVRLPSVYRTLHENNHIRAASLVPRVPDH